MIASSNISSESLPSILSREVVIAAPIALLESALDASRAQYRGSALLEELKRHDFPDAERVVGIVDADAYAPGPNFIFGQAEKPGRVAVVALSRLRHKHPDRFRKRALKITVHELGHTFDFAHCEELRCVMHFANSIGEADYSGTRYCERERLPE